MSPEPRSDVNPRFPLFDSLRGIAALCVFSEHLPYAIRMGPDNPFKPYLLQLNAGVSIFFLASGFLIYRPFARARLRGAAAPALIPYAIRRVLRVVPPYWLALPFVALLVGPAGEAANAAHVFSVRGILSYFGFVQVYDHRTLLGGISAAWSLCVEASFYAMLPLWAWLLRRVSNRSHRAFVRSELLALVPLVLIGVLWTGIAASNIHIDRSVFLDPTRIPPWLYVLPSYIDHFAIGMALAVLSVVVAEARVVPRAVRVIDRAPWLPWLMAATAYFCIGNIGVWTGGNYGARTLGTHVLQGIFALGMLLPAVFGNPDRGLVRKVLSNRVLSWVGIVSYGFYLWHTIVLFKLGGWGARESFSPVAFIGVALTASLLCAAGSFYGLERYAQRLGRRLSHRRRSQDADMRVRDLVHHERVQHERA
jgi:peptidoglycan/LPS O-acetylase OafA/YrhL